MNMKPRILLLGLVICVAPLVLAIDPSMPEAQEPTPLLLSNSVGLEVLTEEAVERPAAQGAPQRALGIDDEDVTNYGLRVRVTGRMFDAAKYQVAQLLSQFSEPQSVIDSSFHSEPGGFNTLLDPGYDTDAKNAGGVRTTPLQMMWSWRNDSCGGDDAACLAANQSNSRRFHWLQTRQQGAPGTACNNDDRIMGLPARACANAEAGAAVAGGILCNQRGVPPYWQNNHREHGFYVASDGQCFDAQNVCTHSGGAPEGGNNRGGWCYKDTCTAHQFNETGALCEMEAQWGGGEPREIYVNIGVFIFPNGLVENAGGGAASGVPAWRRPRTFQLHADGDYFGYVPPNRYGTYTGRDASLHPLRYSDLDGGYRWVASGFPTPGDYDHTNRYDEVFGSYFRAGDDIAFYADVRQMQIHSIDRDPVSTGNYGPEAVAGCGEGPVYTGQLDGDGDPIYFYAPVPQCVRPKSYWHGPPNIAEEEAKNKWVACDPYDTFLPDGSLNPARDDNFPIYPGGTGETCRAQAGDPFSPFDSGGAGTGWSALRMNTFDMDTADNKIDFNLAGNEWRLELAMLFDFATECIVAVSYTSPQCDSRPGYQAKRKWATGTMMIRDLVLGGAARLYSIDDHSCGAAGGDCSGAWGPADDGKVRPDRFRIGLDLSTTDIIAHPDTGMTGQNSFRAIYQDLEGNGFTCYGNVYGDCIFNLGRIVSGDQVNSQALVPQLAEQIAEVFEDQFADLINDMVADINESLPNLSTLLGDPWNFGRSLVDVGIFLTGSEGDAVPDPLDASRNIWTVGFQEPPAGRDAMIDINAALGFRPIAFHSPNAEGVMLIDDPSDGYSADSFFAVPTMYYPDTSDCEVIVSGSGAAHNFLQAGTGWAYDAATGNITGMGASGLRFGQFAFNRTTWRWSQIAFVNKIARDGMVQFYQVEEERQADLGGSSFGVSAGWMTLTINSGNINSLRVGDQFSVDEESGAVYRIAEINAGANQIRLDLEGDQQNRFTRLRPNRPFTIVSRRCARAASRHNEHVEDQQYDNEDYVLANATWTDPKTGISYPERQVIPPHFRAPYDAAPDWCTTPQRAKQDADAMASRFPMNTWLSFDLDADTPPPGATSMSQPGSRNTLGVWDHIPGTAVYGGRGVVQQNQNDYRQKEPGDTQYDASIHVHQRTLNQLAHAVVSSGSACIEFAQTDRDTGDKTPYADFLTTDRFAAFFPEIRSTYPGAEVKFRIAPQMTPRIRTGVGSLNFEPRSDGSADIVDEPYTLGVALPDLQLSLWVIDPEDGVSEVPLFKMNWNTAVGLYLRAMRDCHQLDPLVGADDERCMSTDPLLRTITGYWQLYVDYGNPELGAHFEAPLNALDGFQQGRFTHSDIETLGEGTAKFEVLEAYCGVGCDMLGLAQSLVMLLDSTFSLYVETRASTEFLSIPFDVDFLYIGPDGPNDDGLGTSNMGSRGDYLGVYFRQLGEFDLMGLAGGLMAPEIRPQAEIPALTAGQYVTSNSPRFEVGVRGAPGGGLSQGLYTYRINQGFWRTPRSDAAIELEGLTEGKHVLEVRALEDSPTGMIGQASPTRIEFQVDSLPPEVRIPPSRTGAFTRSVAVEAHDLQTPDEDLKVEYSLGSSEWRPLEGRSISLRGLAEGHYTLRVQATDLAGNTSQAAREIFVSQGGCGGGCNSTNPGHLALVFAAFTILFVRRWLRRVDG